MPLQYDFHLHYQEVGVPKESHQFPEHSEELGIQQRFQKS